VASLDTRTVIVLRGGNLAGGVTVQSAATLSFIGQMGATMNAASGNPGLHVTNTDLYVRGLQILGNPGSTIGIIADGSATIRLDGVDIESMPQGGLRVIDGSGYDVANSIFAANGGTLDDGGRTIGGAFLGMPPSGKSSRFAFNTVIGNRSSGVTCSAMTQTVDASLLAMNLGSGATPDYTMCALASSKVFGAADPMLTSTFRATTTSPCVDFVATPPVNAPDHDIDGISRPQNIKFDCGASELQQ
jgi:hypothetical protein